MTTMLVIWWTVTYVEQLILLNNLNAKGTIHSDHPAISERTFNEYLTDFTETNNVEDSWHDQAQAYMASMFNIDLLYMETVQL